jgi:hypothetical protein
MYLSNSFARYVYDTRDSQKIECYDKVLNNQIHGGDMTEVFEQGFCRMERDQNQYPHV